MDDKGDMSASYQHMKTKILSHSNTHIISYIPNGSLFFLFFQSSESWGVGNSINHIKVFIRIIYFVKIFVHSDIHIKQLHLKKHAQKRILSNEKKATFFQWFCLLKCISSETELIVTHLKKIAVNQRLVVSNSCLIESKTHSIELKSFWCWEFSQLTVRSLTLETSVLSPFC